VVAEGTYQLYPRYDPPLKAGLYRFTADQQVTASGKDQALAPQDEPTIDPLQTHVRVRSPQYALPPDQVLSTFPPANHEGAFGARLPQVVIKRRTLPWERAVDADPDHEGVPWLALVVIAEGEAEIRLNQPVSQCVTPGVTLDPPADVQVGNYLAVRQSAVQRLFPTQDEVGLLAHVREVDTSDTELMMGDDDGFMSVVIANRLPLPAKDDKGADTPVTYLACLVNLCGQLDRLQATEPVELLTTKIPILETAVVLDRAQADQARMRTMPPTTPGPRFEDVEADKVVEGVQTSATRSTVDPGTRAPYAGAKGWAASTAGDDDVYTVMAKPFMVAATEGFLAGDEVLVDPELRFPALLHWSFTTTGEQTFQWYMEHLSSGLLGTVDATEQPVGRPPFEVTATGHVGLDHRLRVGDEVRSWYRGPFVPLPTEDPPGGRLPLAHASDQLDIVVSDGREDVSLAAAFEIGRLLGLSRPSIVASLMRWRQTGFSASWLASTYDGRGFGQVLQQLGIEVTRKVGGLLGATVAAGIVEAPSGVIGDPAPLVTAGRTVIDQQAATPLLAQGLGLPLQALAGTPSSVLGRLHDLPVATGSTQAQAQSATEVAARLGPTVDASFVRTAVQALAPGIKDGTVALGHQQLPPDVLAHLDAAPVPDVEVLRSRLGLHLDKVRLTGSPDAVDVVMHATPDADEEER
jgi:hypothetical protein